MNVLLLSRNHTVSEMVALAFRDRGGDRLVVAEGMDAVTEGEYDIMIVDDTLPGYQEARDWADRLGITHTVLLSQMGSLEHPGFERRIRKPFLPSEIESLVEEYAQVSKASKKQKKKKKKNKSKREKKKRFQAETEVLNLDEIETIKTLLEEDGLEIVHEEELAEKMLKEHKGEEKDRHDALIRALRKMKPRNIRKLLKGASVKIEITFPGADT